MIIQTKTTTSELSCLRRNCNFLTGELFSPARGRGAGGTGFDGIGTHRCFRKAKNLSGTMPEATAGRRRTVQQAGSQIPFADEPRHPRGRKECGIPRGGDDRLSDQRSKLATFVLPASTVNSSSVLALYLAGTVSFLAGIGCPSGVSVASAAVEIMTRCTPGIAPLRPCE